MLYLDASVAVALFVQQGQTGGVQARLSNQDLLVSGFCCAEFSSAIARLVRIGDAPPERASLIYSDFDQWITIAANLVAATPEDMQTANLLVRRHELGLRAPDALHIAIAQRLGATLFTLDNRMAVAADALGLRVET